MIAQNTRGLGEDQTRPIRADSVTTANSVFSGRLSAPTTSKSGDNLGLDLVVDNPNPAGDLVFVHGLGGTAKRTWSYNRDVANFWPSWLALEDYLNDYRVFTFGYNADFRGGSINLNIIDFAKDLLLQLLTFSSHLTGRTNDSGKRNLIFVAHSMGGLVVKKAIILGKHDPLYAKLIARVHGIVFLGTPHRGSSFANVLNNILASSIMGPPPKAYIADLDVQSTTLQDINEQFRTSCGAIVLASFYETLKTNFKVTKQMIVEKESSILGYPQEVSAALHADHHGVCKFANRNDSNYIKVKNVLRMWAQTILPPSKSYVSLSHIEDAKDSQETLETVLGIHQPPEEGFESARSKTTKGSCDWIFNNSHFLEWSTDMTGNNITRAFWLTGPPATGKTILAAAVIDHFRIQSYPCFFHFFTAGHQSKRSSSYCLRSIALQVAQENEAFRNRLISLHERTGILFNSQTNDFTAVWEKLFTGILFKIEFATPLVFVLDAINEADSSALLIRSLLDCRPASPILLFLTSRPMKIPSATAAYGVPIIHYPLSDNDTELDIRKYVHWKIQDFLPDDDEIRRNVSDIVVASASGSFLYVKLVLDMLQDNWHTQEDIRKIFTAVPKGMEELYLEMLKSVNSQSPHLKAMATRIITWVVCSSRPLGIDELQTALEPDFSGFTKLEDSIVQLCGNLVSVDHGRISIVHATARQFLLKPQGGNPAFVSAKDGHELIAIRALKYLCDEKWHRIYQKVDGYGAYHKHERKENRLLIAEKGNPFLGYATCHWAYHVSKAPASSVLLIKVIRTFLDAYSLSWIEGIALSQNLRYLTRAAQQLKRFAKQVSKRSERLRSESPLNLFSKAEDDAGYIKAWATDLIRVAAKFGLNMVQSPSSIHRLVPPFCPTGSMIRTTFDRHTSGSVSVAGLVLQEWDDNLASVSVSEEDTASRILATDTHFITLISTTGTALIWRAETCELERRIDHGEYVRLMAINKSGTLLVTAGLYCYRIWDITTGEEVFSIPKSTYALHVTICFGHSDTQVMVGYDDCSVRTYDAEKQVETSCFIPEKGLAEDAAPQIMQISPDLTKVAMACRGQPPVIWDMTVGGTRPLSCRITNTNDSFCHPEKMIWQADGGSLLVMSYHTKITQWHIYEQYKVEYDHINAREMALSKEGDFLLTSDYAGTISVWLYPRLNLLYQLQNEHEIIRDIAFSPDAQRIYDLRSSVCNVWEPEVLVRAEQHDMEDRSSVGESSTSTEPVLNQRYHQQNMVTAIACSSSDDYLCCGQEDGSVIIMDTHSGAKVRKVYRHNSSSSIELVAWSSSGRYMVSADDSGRVISKRLETKEAGKWGVFGGVDFRSPEPVQQFLINEDRKLLLVSSRSRVAIWDLKTKNEFCTRRWDDIPGHKWVLESKPSARLLRIAADGVTAYDWGSLHELPADTAVVPSISQMEAVGQDAHVTWAELVPSLNAVLYFVSTTVSGITKESLLLATLSKGPSRSGHTIPDDSVIMTHKRRIVGVFKEHFTYIDQDCWLCTWRIGSKTSEVIRHFFMPKEWLSWTALNNVTLTQHGTFLCPKLSEVAIVRNGLNL
ncbi:WD40 repeat-like protein [Pseudovirgaria hyperparasitica]|uniref:GPI inositol-deacylase n=1 Tax=Pseudovirgaria hyperparasitica TaxID=470096 RepID=A0A6A6WCC3_9PEZI|nr:WD40 repeat-like protein [Pseudovirgaria hyperparasitica]KAF2759829.1 WD40 repeat-like protein [Pseudovirgaria hyperparasitica]